MTHPLFTPTRLGDIEIANRIAMAPLTRNRADDATGVPSPLAVEYYAQRASGGLLITEASQISPRGKGYAMTPGIYTPAQVEGWKAITSAVHDRGGRIVIQLWHVGRISHSDLLPGGEAPVSSSATPAAVKTFVKDRGFVETSAPRALRADEIPGVVADYARAAELAMEAGFDGVEIHAANGYLIDQFLKDGINRRDDAYGGSVENRARLLGEVVDAVTGAIPAGRVGIRLSPFSGANDLLDSDPMTTFAHAIGTHLAGRGMAYMHLVEGQTGGPRELAEGQSVAELRKLFDGAYMANNGYDRALAMTAVESGAADVVAFGRPYIANPDLPERLAAGAPLNEGDPSTYYGGGAEGYTDYPTLAQTQAA